MKAYVYRSGHVLIGPSVPEGAIELVEWDNEAELLTVLRWYTRMVNGEDGVPCMAIPEITESGSISDPPTNEWITVIRRQVQRALTRLRRHPFTKAIYVVGPIMKWSPEECLAMAVPQ